MFENEEIFPRKGLGGSSHASTITEGNDGILYAAWYSGTAEKKADVKIYTVILGQKLIRQSRKFRIPIRDWMR